jgi:hypothetical protein
VIRGMWEDARQMAMLLLITTVGAIIFCPVVRASFVDDGLRRMEVLEKKLTELADSTLGDKFSRRPPGRGRSAAEMCLHVAVANFSFGRNVGRALPGTVSLENYEHSTSAKVVVLQRLHESFTYYRHALEKLNAADGDKPINLFGRRVTLQTAVAMTLDHINVHLHQYDRLSLEKEKSKPRLPSALLKLNVVVYDLANVPRRTLTAAEQMTARAFQQVGIETAWIECTRALPQFKSDSACVMRPHGSLDLQLRIITRGETATRSSERHSTAPRLAYLTRLQQFFSIRWINSVWNLLRNPGTESLAASLGNPTGRK